MKILHVIGTLGDRLGGTPATIFPMTEALAALPEMEIEIATTEAGVVADSGGSHAGGKIPIHYHPRRRKDQPRDVISLRRWLKQHVTDYQLLHIHGVWNYASAAAAKAARRAQVPYIVLPQGTLSPYHFGPNQGMRRLLWHLWAKRNVRNARCLQLTSDAERDEIAALRLGNPTWVVPLGVAPRTWELPDVGESARSRFEPAARGRPAILFMSRLNPRKSVHDVLLPAFAPLREKAYMVLAGGRDEQAVEYEGLLRAEISKAGLQDDVLLLGEIPANERLALLDAAAVLALPSRHENFGIVVVEAMARRRPVVISRQVQCAEHVLRAEAGMVLPLQPDAFRQALEQLLDSPTEREARGEAGRSYVREHLGWPRIAEQMVHLYRECIEDPRLAPRQGV